MKQKISKVKNKLREISGYKTYRIEVSDPAYGGSFDVAVYVVKDSHSSLPDMKIEMPIAEGKMGTIRYREQTTLIKDYSGTWSKSVNIAFNDESQDIVGASEITEAEELVSLDIAVIAQVIDALERPSVVATWIIA